MSSTAFDKMTQHLFLKLQSLIKAGGNVKRKEVKAVGVGGDGLVTFDARKFYGGFEAVELC